MAKKQAEAEPESTGTEIMSVAERIAQRIANIGTNVPASGSLRISVKGSKFRIPNGPTSSDPLNAIILDYTNSNAYYKEQFNEGDVAKPDCWSQHRTIGDMVPSSDVENPINNNCKRCEFNKFGSKGRGKMCGNAVTLAIIPVGFEEGDDIYTLKVAAKGLTAWSNYVRELGLKNIDPLLVETSISFVEGTSFPQLKFRSLGPNKQLDECAALVTKAEMLLPNS